MLSRSEVETIFREWLPAHVEPVFVPLDAYINTAMQHPFIQQQMSVGIYNEKNIKTDFLSAACAYSHRNVVEICYELLEEHAKGVSNDDLTVAYLTTTAMHEAHHFEEGHNKPTTAEEHAVAELACIAATKEKDPALEALAQQFERESKAFKRVYNRIEGIQKAMMIR